MMLYFLYTLIIVAFLDTFIQLPVISPYAQSLGASNLLTGMIIAIYSLANMVGNGIAGHWIDRHGRKKILCFGMISVSFILFLYPLAQTGWELFFIRLIHGLAGGALIPAAFAYLGDLAPSRSRGKSMAYSGAGIGTAAIIGPALGGMISARYSMDTVFILAGILFFVTFIATITFLKESFKVSERKEVNREDYLSLIKNPHMLQASISGFSLMTSMGILTYALPLKMESLGWNSSITGILLSTFGIVALFIFLTPINRLFDQLRPQTFILWGLGLVSISLISLNLSDNIFMITTIMIIYGCGFSFIFPSMNRIVVEISKKSDRGKAFGIFYASFSLGVVFGSFTAGVIHDGMGYPLIVGGFFILIMLLIFMVILKYSPTLLIQKQPGGEQAP